MEMAKTVKKYGKIYRKILLIGNYSDLDAKQESYEKRLIEMYTSKKYAEHNIYPTTNTEYIYAIIAMCLELKKFGLSDKEIIDTINRGFSSRRNFFKYGHIICPDKSLEFLVRWTYIFQSYGELSYAVLFADAGNIHFFFT